MTRFWLVSGEDATTALWHLFQFSLRFNFSQKKEGSWRKSDCYNAWPTQTTLFQSCEGLELVA